MLLLNIISLPVSTFFFLKANDKSCDIVIILLICFSVVTPVNLILKRIWYMNISPDWSPLYQLFFLEKYGYVPSYNEN